MSIQQQGSHAFTEILGQGGVRMDWRAGERVREGYIGRMEHLARDPHGSVVNRGRCAVLFVAHNRMPDGREVFAYLVCAAGLYLRLDVSGAPIPRDPLHVRDGFLTFQGD